LLLLLLLKSKKFDGRIEMTFQQKHSESVDFHQEVSGSESRLPACNEDFIVQRYISDKIFTRIRLVFQIVEKCPISQCGRILQKNS